MGLARKLSTWVRRAHAIASKEGPAAVPGAILRGLRVRLHNVWTRDHLWQGRIVELLGNRWQLDGVTVHLNNPAIATRHKALLFNGVYERPERALLLRHFPGDRPLIELGGCVGLL